MKFLIFISLLFTGNFVFCDAVQKHKERIARQNLNRQKKKLARQILRNEKAHQTSIQRLHKKLNRAKTQGERANLREEIRTQDNLYMNTLKRQEMYRKTLAR